MEPRVEVLLSEFRIASRELFNRYFLVQAPWQNQEKAWVLVERFNDLELVLFQKLVSDPLGIASGKYGEPQKDILIVCDGKVSALVNREIDSGYWDFPDQTISGDTEMQFVSFFDWDALAVRDNKYARVRIANCASHPTLVGKHALIEAQGISFRLRNN